MTGVRLILYFLDALSLRAAVRKALRSDADLVIFDRYSYDELANLPLGNPAIRMYIRLINKIVPKPQISYFLDADPAKARERKPEYPLEFLHTNRQSFLELSDQIGGISVIPSMPIQEVKRAIFRLAFEKISFRALDGKSKGDAPVNADSIQLAGLDRA
jgi:thymidylate kinase